MASTDTLVGEWMMADGLTDELVHKWIVDGCLSERDPSKPLEDAKEPFIKTIHYPMNP